MSTNSNLEDFFAAHNDQIKQNDLPNGHFERMEQRLKNQTTAPQKQKITLWPIWSAAAAAIVIIVFAIQYTNSSIPAETATTHTTADTLNYAEVELYYNQQIDAQISELNKNTGSDTLTLGQLMQTLNDLEHQYNQLKKELASGIDSEQITERMIDNYKMRLDLLNHVNNQLQKTLKTKNHAS